MKGPFSLFVSACLIAALLSTACAARERPAVDFPAAEPREEASAAAPAGVKPTVRLATWATTSPEMEAVSSLESDAYQIVLESTAYSDYWAKLLTEAVSGTSPDLMWMVPDRMQQFLDNQFLLDLTEYCPEVADAVDSYPAFAAEGFHRNGELYAVPWDMNLRMLYVNKDRLDAAGLSYPPKTWDELREIADKLTSSGVSEFGLALEGFARDGSGASGACYVSGDFVPCPFDWRVAMQQGTLPMVIDWASMDYDKTDGAGNNIYAQNIIAYPPPQNLDGRRVTTVGFTGTSANATVTGGNPVVCSALQDSSSALRSSVGFLFTQSECADQGSAVTRLAGSYGKPAESAQNIVNVVCSLDSATAAPWDVTGDATLVPGDPVMQGAADALSGQLQKSNPPVDLNLDRAVVLSNVHSAPIVDPKINEDEFWSIAASSGFVVGADVIPDDNDIGIPGGAYAVQVMGPSGEEKLEYVDPSGTVYTPPYLGRTVNPYPDLGPYAGIRYGSENCTKCVFGICWTCRCR